MCIVTPVPAAASANNNGGDTSPASTNTNRQSQSRSFSSQTSPSKPQLQRKRSYETRLVLPTGFMILCVTLSMLGFQAWVFSLHTNHHHQQQTSQHYDFQGSSKPQLALRGTNVADPLSWTNPWTGLEFEQYKKQIDDKIKAYRHETSSAYKKTCEMPLYDGEFGYELAGMIPWAYHQSKHNDCKVHTKGRPGTKYLYYFSNHHSIESAKKGQSQRESHRLPKDSPLGETPHFGDDKFPTKAEWTPPPYKEFFTRSNDTDVMEALDKPLLILSNKYTMEWSSGPTNHIPLETLREILKFLAPRYHIVYNRFKDARLEDKLESKIEKNGGVGPYGDKEMIKRFFPSVVLFEELSQNLETDDVNLLMFSLSATASKFVSVQGGNSVVASFFGGTNVIHCVRGPEINYSSEHGGDFSYYYRFSNATIEVAQDAIQFCNAVKQHTAMDEEDLESLSHFCKS